MLQRTAEPRQHGIAHTCCQRSVAVLTACHSWQPVVVVHGSPPCLQSPLHYPQTRCLPCPCLQLYPVKLMEVIEKAAAKQKEGAQQKGAAANKDEAAEGSGRSADSAQRLSNALTKVRGAAGVLARSCCQCSCGPGGASGLCGPSALLLGGAASCSAGRQRRAWDARLCVQMRERMTKLNRWIVAYEATRQAADIVCYSTAFLLTGGWVGLQPSAGSREVRCRNAQTCSWPPKQ